MRVFIVNPSSRRESTAGVYSEGMNPMAPRGVAVIAAVARDMGHEVFVEDQYATHRGAAHIADFVVKNDVDILGLSVLSPNVPMVEEIVRLVKGRRNKTHIVLGNTHASYFSKQMLEENEIDSVVLGEGEKTFAEVLRRIESGESLAGIPGLSYREDGRIHLGRAAPQIENLDKLPRPAWELFNLDHYIAPPRLIFQDRLLALESSRGCPWKCSYCAQYLWTPKVRKRSMESVVEEIQWAVEKFGVSSFGFEDAVFPWSEKDGLEFADLMERRALSKKIRWFSTTRSDLVTKPLLGAMKKSGCLYVLYGFESASAKHLKAAGKDIDPRRAFETMKMTREAGLLAYGVFMIGFPDETPTEAKATIRYAVDLDPDVASFARVTPYPGTPLYEKYQRHLGADTPSWQWNNQYRPLKNEKMWELPGMSTTQIMSLLQEAMLRFYLRPRIIWRSLKIGVFSVGDMIQGGIMMFKGMLQKLL